MNKTTSPNLKPNPSNNSIDHSSDHEELGINKPKTRPKIPIKIKIVLASTIFIFVILGLVFWYLKPWQNLAGVKNPVILKEEAQNTESVPFKVEQIAANLKVPWSLAFTSKERILVTERAGNVRVVENGQVKVKPLVSFSEVRSEAEEGLMGLALDPNYQQNKYVYVCMAYQRGSELKDKVVRFTDRGDSANDFTTIIDNIPAAEFHAGCKLRFGPDNKLYITTGDATDKNIAQDLNNLGGKILRINADGSIPEENPYAGSPVWSYGHRNPQGICWQPSTNQLFSVEHGPSGNDGPGGGDEINIIAKGGNYGWPLVSHTQTRQGTVAPILLFTPAVAPGGCTFYSGKSLPQFSNNMFFAALRGQGLYRIEFSNQEPTQITKFEKVPGIDYGRLREVIEGPDENIYFTTSNTDGRGTPKDSDDKIMVIKPQ